MILSKYENIYDKKGSIISLEDALDNIMCGANKTIVEKIRDSQSKDEKSKLKLTLPVVTFGGLFENRKKLIRASKLASLDIDSLSNVLDVKASIIASKYVYSAWVSPSGNGLKVLVRIPEVESKNEYKEYYRGIENYFKEYKLDKTSDINRLCFESYDPDLYLNKDSKVYEKKLQMKEPNQVNLTNVDDSVKIARRINMWQGRNRFLPGNRNNAIFNLCLGFKSDGIPEDIATSLCLELQEIGFSGNEIKQIIKSVYNGCT